jgi:hypothetical protein
LQGITVRGRGEKSLAESGVASRRDYPGMAMKDIDHLKRHCVMQITQ